MPLKLKYFRQVIANCRTFADNYPGIESRDYEIDWTGSGNDVTSQASPAAEESTNQNRDRFWSDWRAWQRTVFVLGIIIGSALLLVVVVLIAYYGCYLG